MGAGDYLQRRVHTLDVTIASGAALSEAFDFRLYTMAVIRMPSAWTTANVGFKVCNTEAGTFLPLYDKNNTLVQIATATASEAHSAPAELAGSVWVKLWSQASGVNTNQGAARTVGVDLKA